MRLIFLDCVSLLFVLLACILCVSAPFEVGADCMVPADAAFTTCPAFTTADLFAALFGRESAVASLYCSAVCSTPWSSRDEFFIRWEMEGWIRANRTVGMFPEAYRFVRDELMRLTNNLQGDESQDQESEITLHAKRANATLRSMPWLLVSGSVLNAADLFYRRNVQQRLIVRYFHIKGDASGLPEIRRYLNEVAGWWANAEKKVARDPRVTAPFLPRIYLEQFISMPVVFSSSAKTDPSSPHDRNWKKGPANPTQRRSFYFTPPKLPLPTAVVFHYSDDCVACEALGAAFDLLPLIYTRLCEHGHHSVVSCSPLVLFFRATGHVGRKTVPALVLYGAPLHSLSSLQLFFSFSLDVDEFFRLYDDASGIALYHDMSPNLADNLASMILQMTRWGIIQPRYLSPVEVSEMDRLEAERIKRDKIRRLKRARGKNTTSDTTTRFEELQKLQEEEAAAGLARHNGRVVSADQYFRDLVMFHMRELLGNGTAEVELRGSLSWWQMEPQWITVVSAFLCVVWFLFLFFPQVGGGTSWFWEEIGV